MKTALLGIAMICALPVTAAAFQCPTLQAQIDKEFGKRFDRTAANARSIAAQAVALHRDGKHAESVKMFDEAAKAGGLTLTHKK